MKKNILVIIAVIIMVIITLSLLYTANPPEKNTTVTVTVDGSIKYQKIDGFGGSVLTMKIF